LKPNCVSCDVLKSYEDFLIKYKVVNAEADRGLVHVYFMVMLV